MQPPSACQDNSLCINLGSLDPTVLRVQSRDEEGPKRETTPCRIERACGEGAGLAPSRSATVHVPVKCESYASHYFETVWDPFAHLQVSRLHHSFLTHHHPQCITSAVHPVKSPCPLPSAFRGCRAFRSYRNVGLHFLLYGNPCAVCSHLRRHLPDVNLPITFHTVACGQPFSRSCSLFFLGTAPAQSFETD